MSGFTDQLVTRMQGTHLSPPDNNQDPSSATSDALEIGKETVLGQSDIELIGNETQLTPPSNGLLIPAAQNPFKLAACAAPILKTQYCR